MGQLSLVNRSGKTIITGDYVKFYPNSRDSFVFADIGDANIIGQAAQTVSSGARCLINLLNTVDYTNLLNKPTITEGHDITNASTIVQAEIDFGSTPVEEKDFTIVNASITTASLVMAQIAYVAPTGKDLDELEFDSFDFRCVAVSGGFTLHARSLEGLVADKFVINYSFCNP
jgi:hypothetical protein